jgi:hypothetical protein
MPRFSPALHLAAILIAGLVVFVAKPQKRIKLKPILPESLQFSSIDFTNHYPGQHELYRQEIFSPRYAHTKKIVILGSSVANSLGCDSTWSKENLSRSPTRNVHINCSITGHLNQILKESHLDGWRAFDLACDSSRQLNMLFTYTRIMELHPEIVIFVDSFPYAETQNAGAAELDPQLFAYMDHQLSQIPAVEKVWRPYVSYLTQQGPATGYKLPVVTPGLDYTQKTTIPSRLSLNDILVNAFGFLRNRVIVDVAPLPALPNPDHRPSWTPVGDGWNWLIYLPPEYMAGFKVFDAAQTALGGKFIVAFAPLYDQRNNPHYLKEVRSGMYGQYFQKEHLRTLDLIDLPLRPVYETYDGFHQTTYGNAKIADAIFQNMKEQKLLP